MAARVGADPGAPCSEQGLGRAASKLGWSGGIVLLVAACGWTQQRPVERVTAPAAAATGVATAAAAPVVAPTPASDDARTIVRSEDLSAQVAVAIQQVEGTTAEAAAAFYAPATDPVRRCTPKAPGALQVKVTRDSERTDMEVVSGSSVDPSTRRCVLAALAMLDAEDPPAPSGTPSAEPRSFSSTVSISW